MGVKKREHFRILVVTEGRETERQYVERLHQTLRDGDVSVAVRTVGLGDGPHAVLKKCVELRSKARSSGKAYDHCVCIVDVDQHTSLPDTLSAAAQQGIHVIVSNLKFEVWLLWHAVDVRGARSSKQLDELMAKHGLLKGKHLANDFPISNYGDAIGIARAIMPGLQTGLIGPDPSSTMPALIDLLLGTPFE